MFIPYTTYKNGVLEDGFMLLKPHETEAASLAFGGATRGRAGVVWVTWASTCEAGMVGIVVVTSPKWAKPFRCVFFTLIYPVGWW